MMFMMATNLFLNLKRNECMIYNIVYYLVCFPIHTGDSLSISGVCINSLGAEWDPTLWVWG